MTYTITDDAGDEYEVDESEVEVDGAGFWLQDDDGFEYFYDFAA